MTDRIAGPAVCYYLVIVATAFAQAPEFDADNAFDYLEEQCRFGPRNPGSEGYEQCREWLYGKLAEYCDEVYRQSFEEEEGVTGTTRLLTNLIGRIAGGGGPGLMLCAHWDTRAVADMEDDPDERAKPILGANDGASGVAVVLEMARLASETPPPRELIFALFDGEDMGRSRHPEEYALGSKHWAQHPVPQIPREAILLDMIGDADLEIPLEPYSEANAPGLQKYLWELAAELQLDAFVMRMGAPAFDDHVRLQRIGIRAVNLIDFDYPHWHTSEDTPDKCSAGSLKLVGRLLVAFIYGRN